MNGALAITQSDSHSSALNLLTITRILSAIGPSAGDASSGGALVGGARPLGGVAAAVGVTPIDGGIPGVTPIDGDIPLDDVAPEGAAAPFAIPPAADAAAGSSHPWMIELSSRTAPFSKTTEAA
jgi:hypothetical protein